MIARDYPVGTVMTGREAAEEGTIGLVDYPGHGLLVYITQPNGQIAGYDADQAELIADAWAQNPVLAERMAPALRELARQVRASRAAGGTA